MRPTPEPPIEFGGQQPPIYSGPLVSGQIPQAPPVSERLEAELEEAKKKALDALARYKFQMFGYWAAIWVHLNRISGQKHPSPFRNIVAVARAEATR